MKRAAVIVALCVAVVAAAIAAIVVFNQRAAVARADAARAESEAEAAAKNAKAAEAERGSAALKVKEAEAKAAAAKTALAAAEAENERLRLENDNLVAKKALAAETRAAADAEAKAAADRKAVKELEAKTVKEAADAERAKAAAAADELARAEATKAIREAETLKLRVSMAELAAERQRYEELAQELADFQRDLEERERALRPEKTITDLVWLADEDTEVDADGKAHPRKKEPYLAENDKTLPKESRELARAERRRQEADDILAKSVRERTVSRLETLYVAALKSDRAVDAEYYRDALKSFYPDWEYKAPPNEQTEVKSK